MLWPDGEPGRERLDVQVKPLSCLTDRLGEAVGAERAEVTQHLQAVGCLPLLQRLRGGHLRVVPIAAWYGCGLLERPGARRVDLRGREAVGGTASWRHVSLRDG